MGMFKLNLQQRCCDKSKCSFFLPYDDDDDNDNDDDDDHKSPRTDQDSVLLGHVTLRQWVTESRRHGTRLKLFC
jgi:hypothetical protein